jgi:hypothetical protein
MTRRRLSRAIALVLVLGSVAALRADVKTEEKNQVTFAGALGRIMNLFGGKAAKEGVISSVAVSGDRKMTMTDASGQIIDLQEEKVYDLDVRRKTYTVTTFAELRKQMQEAQAKAEQNAKQSGEAPPKDGREMEVEVSVKNTGQAKTINGFDTRQMIVIVTVHEKGRTLEQSGGLVLTADTWLTESVPALKEIADFDVRYAAKLQGPFSGVSAEQMATALAMYPGLKEAMTKYQGQGVQGTPILTTVTVESVRSPEQAQQAQQQASTEKSEPAPASVGGLIGGFGRRIAKKPEAKEGDQKTDNTRATVMTTNHEVLKISTSVSAADVAMPAGFRGK